MDKRGLSSRRYGNTPEPGEISPHPMKVGEYMLAPGECFPGCSVLGCVTATGELKVSKADATDGSEKPFAVIRFAMHEPCPKPFCVQVIRGGELNVDMLKFDSSHIDEATGLPTATAKKCLADNGIELRSEIYSGLSKPSEV